jgi:apolipoprotein N-acyltransferase
VSGGLAFRLPYTDNLLLPSVQLMQGVGAARGWRRASIAFGAGAASALSQAPINFWPVLFVTFPLLVWLIDGTRQGRGRAIWSCAVTGWCFGFGYFVAGLYWIGHAFLVDAQTFGWLLPIAVTGLPAYLAVFTALGCAGARLLWTRGASRILAFAVALTIAEWARGHALTGFPWNVFGYALASPLPLAQIASILGIWGMTFVALAVFATPATLIDDRADTPRRWLPLLVATAVLVALALFGALRLSHMPTRLLDGVALRIMQPNLQQDSKFNYSAKAQVMSRYIALSGRMSALRPHGLADVTHLIWPESAFPFYLSSEPDALAQLAAMLPEKTLLLTGADRTGAPPPGAAGTDVHTSIYVIDHQGSVPALYDKVHLVPFGEFLPFQSLLERVGLTQLTKVVGGLVAGGKRQPMPVPGTPATIPLLCYEVIFADEIRRSGAQSLWLLNLTNDGWFGISSGPYQHFSQARLRAIEQGLPLVRAANTGISAVVDPVGRIIQSLPLGAEGLLDAPLPAAIAPTFYARFGDALVAVLLAGALVIVVRRRIRERARAR